LFAYIPEKIGKKMKKKLSLLIIFLLLFAVHLSVTTYVEAASKIIVVPDNYPTIKSAIGNATDGDTILVKAGIYEEQTLEINKRITLIGHDVNSSIINLHPSYNVSWILSQFWLYYENSITINVNDVTFSNLTINNNGGSIVVTGDGTQIIGNNIAGISEGRAVLIVNGCHNNITGNIIESSRSLAMNGSYNFVAQNVLSRINLGHFNSSTITNNTIYNTIGGSMCNQNVFSKNLVSIYTSFSNSSNNVFTENSFGSLITITLTNTVNNTFYHNLFGRGGEEAVHLRNASNFNFWDNGVEGNFWTDYNGSDADGDGVGDVPYVVDANNVDRYPLMEPYDIENGKVVVPSPRLFSGYIVSVIVVVVIVVVCFFVYLRNVKSKSLSDQKTY
jgi:nitrous oxidase accessory protein